MGLFGFGKKKEEETKCCCTCGENGLGLEHLTLSCIQQMCEVFSCSYACTFD